MLFTPPPPANIYQGVNSDLEVSQDLPQTERKCAEQSVQGNLVSSKSPAQRGAAGSDDVEIEIELFCELPTYVHVASHCN